MNTHRRLEKPVVRTSRVGPVIAGCLGLTILFAAGGSWMAMAEIAGAVVTTGSIAVEGKAKTIQHVEGGMVSAINVKDGDLVKAGDVILQLDDTLLRANINVYTNRLREAVAVRNRLLAERDGLDEITTKNKELTDLDIEPDQEVEQAQRKLFDARRIMLEGQITQLEEQIAQFRNQIVGIEAQEAAYQEQLGLLDEQLVGAIKLEEQGYGSMTVVRDLKRQRAELSGELGEAVAGKAQAENSINEAEIQILQARRESLQNVLAELTQSELEVRDLTQQLSATKIQIERTAIRAPIDGMVHQLSIFTIGGVVTPGAPIMQIVPQDHDLEVEITVEPQFIDDLYIGQLTGVRFSAFNQRTTPELNGTIASVSPSTMTDEENNATYYTARVNVPKEELSRLGNEQLIPGMPVEVFVKTEERTALTYLVKPLMDHINRAFREE